MKTPRVVSIAVAALAVAVVALAVLYGIALHQISDQADKNAAAIKALCVLRSDLRQRVLSSQTFLNTHPDGIPGVPAKTIRDGVVNQQRTIKALQSLKCTG